VKASPESGAFERGRSGGQQVRKPLVCEVAAVLPLSVQENRGKEGRGERRKLRGPEAGRRVVKPALLYNTKSHKPCGRLASSCYLSQALKFRSFATT
jgi:hypothetical protein